MSQSRSVYTCLYAVGIACAILILGPVAPVAGQTSAGPSVKVAFFNIQSGKGEPALTGRTQSFVDTANCTDTTQPLNAWGVGFVQRELLAKIGKDASIIALGLAESWASVCGSPENVRKVLGWKSVSVEKNGLAVVARHGFKGVVSWVRLDTTGSTNTEPRHVGHVQVCVDAACSSSYDYFFGHWGASGSALDTVYTRNAQETLAFMMTKAEGRPHAFLGDLNTWSEGAKVCNQNPQSASILDVLRNAGYRDGWRAANGAAEGFTGMTNRAGCGNPEGYGWKRIDYAWSLEKPLSMTRFAVVPAGDAAPSDHYGIIAEYALAGAAMPPLDPTGPDTSITAPAADATVAAVVTVTAEAIDAAGVSKVEFFADGASIGTDAAEPFTASWDTRSLSNGVHTLQVRATDSFGNTSLSNLTSVTVQNGVEYLSTIDEVVMYASTAKITGTLWQIADDATAASGRRLHNADLGAARPAGASASPANYAELTFRAEKGKAYRLWVRGKAVSNGWANDSMFVQFSDTVDASGAATWRIGTTSYTTVQVEEGSNAGLSGWGWADNAWGGVGPLVYFANDGDHTLRLQIREDGLSIDQLVLSAVKYATLAPGATKNDTTILELPMIIEQPPAREPDPPSDPTSVPTSWAVPTDRLPRAKPAVPVIGSAGFQFQDPTFGSRLMRVTDGQTRPGTPNRSYRTPSASHQNAWNTTGTYFYIISTDGSVIPFSFDAATMTASRVNPTTTGTGGLTLSFFGEPQFSYVSENLIYGAQKSGTLRTIRQFDFTTGQYSLLLDLDTLGANLTGTYVGGIMSSAGTVEKVLVWYGGTAQDRHYRVTVFERENPARRRVVDTLASTIDGVPTSTLLNFKLHHVQIDRSGRYVLLSPTTADRQAPRYAAAEYVWDMQTDVITPLPETTARASGHNSLGFETMINQDCCTSGTWDAAQWQLRSLAAPLTTRDVMTPVLLPKEVYLAEHTSWHNARGGQNTPFFASLYRYGTNTTAWRAWDDEIVAIGTEPSASTTVWRFAHHRTDVRSDANPLQSNFWYMPRVNVAQNGRWAIFTSNWEKTLGRDAGVTNAIEYRQDVFVVELAASTPPVQNQLPSVAVNAPAAGAVLTAGSVATIKATATDNDGSIARVDFHVDGMVVGSASAAPLTTTWAVPSAGTYTLTAVAFDNAGGSTRSQPVTVTAVAPVSIATSALPAAVAGTAYSQALEAEGGLGSYTWSVVAGSLPPGLSLSASGQLTGTSSADGSWMFTVRAQDSASATRAAEQALTLVVSDAPNQLPTVVVTAPARAAVLTAGAPVVVSVKATDTDGTIQHVNVYANGALIGSSLTSPFAVTWVVPAVGSYELTAEAQDNRGGLATSALVTVTAVERVTITTTALPSGTVGKPYAAMLQAKGGLGTYTWSVTRGVPPAGVALSATGNMSGTPSAAGSWTFDVTAADAADPTRSAVQAFTISIREPNKAPTVSMTSPVEMSSVAVRHVITVGASAADVDGTVARVDFYANGVAIGSKSAAPFAVDWTVPAAGKFALTAVATDGEGASTTSAAVTVVATDEIVLYASDVKKMVGNYQLVADSTAANGQRLWNANNGAAKLAVSATPGNYAEFTFYAEAGRAYHIWMRGKADQNTWANDSAYIQFSGTVDAAGTPVNRIGTTGSQWYSLEEDTNIGVAGWGWQENGYGLGVMGADLYFEKTGLQTLRIQQREDGLSIDQIVISPVRNLTTSPGVTKNDTTIVGR